MPVQRHAHASLCELEALTFRKTTPLAVELLCGPLLPLADFSATLAQMQQALATLDKGEVEEAMALRKCVYVSWGQQAEEELAGR